MHEQGRVAPVVEQHVGAELVRPGQRLLRAPPVLFERLALPGEHRDAARVIRRAVGAHSDGRGGVVLGGEDVAASPADLGAERDQRLDQYGCLDRHVQRSGDPRVGEKLVASELLAQRHQSRHLMLGQPDLVAAELGQRKISDLERYGLGGHLRSSSSGMVRLRYNRPYGSRTPSRILYRRFLTGSC